MFRTVVVLTLFALPVASPPRVSQGGAAAPGTFTVSGDPASASGAPWTFQGTIDGVTYDLTGVLLKPEGNGPFPAVVLSHGFEGNAAMIARDVYPGGHLAPRSNPLMFDRVRAWYQKYGMF